MQIYLERYKNLIKNKDFVLSLALSLVMLFASLIINHFMGVYATENASLPVTDIILSNIPVYNVNFMFTYGPVIFLFFTTIICLCYPRRLPFVIKSLALFVIIRSLFISLTHLGPFPTQAVIDSASVFNKFTFGADLFFSGHTGQPFLMALIFWQNKYLRYIFISISIIFGATVLMGHLHYSIDVLSAFFITYGIFHIALYVFKRDRLFFLGEDESVI